MISVRDTEEFAETSHLQCLYPFNVCCYGPSFTCIQKYGHGQGTLQSDLGVDGDVLVVPDNSSKKVNVIVCAERLSTPVTGIMLHLMHILSNDLDFIYLLHHVLNAYFGRLLLFTFSAVDCSDCMKTFDDDGRELW